MADMGRIKPKERGRQVRTNFGCHRSNGALDFSLGEGHQAVMLGEHLGSPSAGSVKVGDGTRVGAVECSEPALCIAYGVANGHGCSLSGAVPATAPT
jgi:hypothetical protein